MLILSRSRAHPLAINGNPALEYAQVSYEVQSGSGNKTRHDLVRMVTISSAGVVCGIESWRSGAGFFIAGGGRRAAQRISVSRLSREAECSGDVPPAGLDADVRVAVANSGFAAREV